MTPAFFATTVGMTLSLTVGGSRSIQLHSATSVPKPRANWVTLNDGKQMPMINLGTCCGSKPSVGLMPWIRAGGVGIDSAIGYGDQTQIGSILHENNISRSSVYITSKTAAGCGQIADCAADPNVTVASVRASLAQFNISYIDLMLLHRPCQQLGKACSIDPVLSNCTGPDLIKDPNAANNALWQGMMHAQKLGLVKSIGVSNYNVDELKALGGAVPAVNQCEMSLMGYDNDTIAYCQQHNITYESYGAMRGCPFKGPGSTTVAGIAQTHNVSVSQVCLRWVLQRGCVIASGTGADSSTVGPYAKENLDIFNFSLTPAEMGSLNAIEGLETTSTAPLPAQTTSTAPLPAQTTTAAASEYSATKVHDVKRVFTAVGVVSVVFIVAIIVSSFRGPRPALGTAVPSATGGHDLQPAEKRPLLPQ
eukprot:m.305232 g.305232  ORF g.305232 m.305232 type:complete len:421 (+) comp20177_c0_seq1:127-1389(+)